MKERSETDSRIELRSEKVRKIAGPIPSALVRWGFVIIMLILATLVAVIAWFPYPYGGGETIMEHVFDDIG